MNKLIVLAAIIAVAFAADCAVYSLDTQKCGSPIDNCEHFIHVYEEKPTKNVCVNCSVVSNLQCGGDGKTCFSYKVSEKDATTCEVDCKVPYDSFKKLCKFDTHCKDFAFVNNECVKQQ